MLLKSLYLMREVIFAASLPVNIRCGTMQSAAESAHIGKFNRNDFKSELVELLHLILFLGIYTDGFGIYHQRIHRQPGAAERQWRIGVQCGFCAFDDLPVILREELDLIGGQRFALAVAQCQAGAQSNEGCINVNGVFLVKPDRMDAMVGKVPAQPFDPELVGNR